MDAATTWRFDGGARCEYHLNVKIGEDLARIRRAVDSVRW
jgi:hypothetical protein